MANPEDLPIRKRARRGSGYIGLRKDGLWVGQISFGKDQDGKRRRLVVYGHSKSEVKAKLRGARDPYRLRQRQQLGPFLAGWLEEKKGSLRVRTLEVYRQSIARIAAKIGNVPLMELRPRHLHGLFEVQRKDGDSIGLIYRDHSVLRSALSHAESYEYVERNVAKVVRPQRPRRPERQSWTAEQTRRFLDAITVRWFRVLANVTILHGLRLGEVLGLQWEDVDFAANVLHIRHQATEVNGHFIGLYPPKSDRGRRDLPLVGTTRGLLDDWRQNRPNPESKFVFETSGQRPISQTAVRNAMRRARIIAGVPKITFHQLRHTFGSFGNSAGVPIKTMQAQMGHAQMSTTLEIYSHAEPAALRAGAMAIEKVLYPEDDLDDLMENQGEDNGYLLPAGPSLKN